jgi:hypothetical protein
MSLVHVALVPETANSVDPADLARVAAAVQRQISRDFGPIWGIDATVDAFPALELVPLGYWPVIITHRDLGDDEGFHLTSDREPYAIVEALPGWSLTASHEILEMLADPSGTRTIPTVSPDPDAPFARVEFLLEICDPCQSADCAYTVNDVLVSDFVTPAFFEPPGRGQAGRPPDYSFRGNIEGPQRLARGGAMTWLDRALGHIVHVTRGEGDALERTLLPANAGETRPLRASVHAGTNNRRPAMRVSGIVNGLKASRKRLGAQTAMRARAELYRKELVTLGRAEHATLVTPKDADVKQRLELALARVKALKESGEQVDPGMIDLLTQAREQLDAPIIDPEEAFALNLVKSALRSPAAPTLLTARDVPGLAQYDHEDIRWAKALFEYAFHRKAPFPVCPVQAEGSLVHPIADTAVIALAGDWGTHDVSSRNIGNAISALRPTHTIHLGDVYYAGTEDEERQFIRDWPAGSAGTFALNSNHEMYSGGAAYFGLALQSDKFDYQTYSYFALTSSSWLFIALDSAYQATRRGPTPYDVGRLPANDPQVAWIKRLLASKVAFDSSGARKRCCLLTHHQGLETNGSESALYADVKAAFGGVPDLWYWGHIHGAAVYQPRVVDGRTFRGRLIGHGGIPFISDFQPAGDAAARIEWAERSVGNATGVNGFAVLRLAGAKLSEEFYDERGGLRYSTTLAP